MMPEEQVRYQENRQWFNQFFNDVRQLIIEIHQTLAGELGFKNSNRGWYYEKSNHVPSLPPYWLIATAETGFALQIYVILDTTYISPHPLFTPDLSLIFIKHDRSDRTLYSDEYGKKVLKNNGITHHIVQNIYMSGDILRSEPPHTKYHAFQVPLSAFTTGRDIHQAILDEIVSVIRELPDWNQDN
jgi:hypothetical protein